MKQVRKAVILAAGFGTRFLPASKAVPKEMLPIVNKPVIQYVVEELADAGIEQIIFVVNEHKKAIKEHFDHNIELENKLSKAEKTEELDQVRKISDMAEFIYVNQKTMYGTGGAILAAKDIVGDESFVVLFGDDFMVASPSRTKQLIESYNEFETTILGAIRTDNPADADRYGFASGEKVNNKTIKIEQLIEKPGVEKRPSNLAIVSGFIFPFEIFAALEGFKPEEGKELHYKELHYIDGVNELKKQGKDAYAIEIEGARYYDCGNVTEYLKTNVEIALKRDDLQDEFGKFIKETAAKL